MFTLITGASSGIGLELARIAAQKGQNLILVARNEKILNNLKEEWERSFPIQVKVFACDLSENHAVDSIVHFLQLNKLQVNVLINNAGFGLFGKFDETDLEKEAAMMQVNMVALTQLSKYIYREMLSLGKGQILNVASIAGFMPGPLMSVYYASKAFVISFSQALAKEAKGTGVSVTVLCPGPTHSNFEKNADLSSSMLFKSFGKLPTSKDVATFAFRKMEKGKTLAIHGNINRLLIFCMRFIPRNWITSIVNYIQRSST